jgi:membrane associated rhomboid family serine protease
VFIPKSDSFETLAEDSFNWVLGAFGIGTAIWLIMLLIPGLDRGALRKFLAGRPAADNEMKEFLKLFIPQKRVFVTPILIDLNLLVFVIMVFSGLGFPSFKGSDLLTWGANFKPVTTNGQWWRLITCTFLHGNVVHLVANMSGLWLFGYLLEPMLDKGKYAIMYLVTGIVASTASIWWYEATISVGASGPIFGLCGVFVALLRTKLFPRELKVSYLLVIGFFVAYNLVVGLMGGIDNAAHIGGFLSGVIIGLIAYPFLKARSGRHTSLESRQHKV